MAEKRRYAADSADFAFDVVKREIAFGRGIKFEHARNVEPLLETLPHVGTKPVAAGEPQSVRAFARMLGRMHQIAAQLADILEQRAVEIADVVPEFLRGKFVADDDGAAVDQYGAGRDNAADRMIHRQTIVHAVVRAAVHQACEPQTPLQQPLMADIGGLRQSGRARGVDQERAVGDDAWSGVRRQTRRRLDSVQWRDRFAKIASPFAAPCAQRIGWFAKMRARRLERIGQFRGDDDMFRRDQVNTMRKRRSAKLRVEQRHDAARGGDAEPDCHIIGTIRHQERDCVALGHICVERPARIAVGARGKLREG